MTSHKFNKGKAESNPRFKPPAQTNRSLNPIFARILRIVSKVGGPEYYRRDISIDRSSITSKHPGAVIWGYRDTGTELICLSRGQRASAPKEVRLFGSSRPNPRTYTWFKAARDKITFWSKSTKMNWYYITPSSTKKITENEALSIIEKFAGIHTSF